MRKWDSIITERDKEVYKLAGFGERDEFGKRPALVIIDVNYNFVGDKPEPVLESVKKFSHSCGEEGWDAVGKIRELLEVARPKHVPIYYTTGYRFDEKRITRWGAKNKRVLPSELRAMDQKIVEEIAPLDGEIVIKKIWPSAFFSTPLLSFLIAQGVDTVLLCGCTTSGCIRATTIDSFSYNFHTVVIEECTFDRGQASHLINLFDINQKYANVLSLGEVKNYLNVLSAR